MKAQCALCVSGHYKRYSVSILLQGPIVWLGYLQIITVKTGLKCVHFVAAFQNNKNTI